jgi:glycosyltransferase involved in cell wall biosynthesis
MKIVILEPNVCVMAGMVRLAFMMGDVFKGLGHDVTVVGRTYGEVCVNVPVSTFGKQQILHIRQGLIQRHYRVKELRKFQPVKYLTHRDVRLERIPTAYPFMYFAENVRQLLFNADLVFTGAEIYVKLPEVVKGVERKQVQYVHWPLTTLQPVEGHTPRMIWANSIYTQQHVKAIWGLDSTVVYPPTYCAFYQNERRFEDRPFDVVLLGRLDASKIESVLPALKEFKVAVVGSAYGYEKNLPSWVTLYKNASMKEAADVLAQSKVYVHGKGFGTYGGGKPSEAEHFGQTIVEAMSAGCVPIVPNVGGPPEIVGSEEQYGHIFGSIEDLRTIIQSLVQSKQYWTDRSAAAMKRAQDFDVNIVSRQVQQLL